MRIERMSIQNYKSLKHISLSLKPLSVLVGANASGKSNFADCIDFIAEVYRHGLEIAIGRKGGYENIAYRRTRRSKQPIRIDLSVRLFPEDVPLWFQPRKNRKSFNFRIEHSFSFVVRGYSIRADFRIVDETIIVYTLQGEQWEQIFRIERDQESKIKISPDRGKPRKGRLPSQFDEIFEVFGFPEPYSLRQFIEHAPISSTDLIMNFVGRFGSGFYGFREAMENIRVFQLTPTKTREFGVPTPRPELARSGTNLPAVIDVMKKNNTKQWELILQIMRSILPDLLSIDVDYTSSRTLGLFFKDRSIGRPWSVDEVSDGTIQTLGLLVAIFDPTTKALVLEEPENSVHPWIIRHTLDACREASKNKQIIITTHSPIVINAFLPDEVLVIWRADGASHIRELSQLDPGFIALWERGEVPTFEYLDSGVLPQAIPPTPSDESLLEDL